MIYKPSMDPLDTNFRSVDTRELYFLITKFLNTGPCRDAAEVLKREISQHGLLPKKLDWEGEEHEQTFDELERKYPHIGPEHLKGICARIGPLLDKEIPPIVHSSSSLLGTGRQSLLRTAKSVVREWYSIKEYSARLHQHPLQDPPNFLNQHNTVKALVGRENSGPLSRTHIAGSKLYSKLNLHRKTLGHLSAVYCVLFDRTGKYIITGADDLLVKIWDAYDGRLLSTLRGASSEITDIAINNENTLLAAGSLDRILRVWCMQYCNPIAVLTGHTGMITSVHFCPAVINEMHYLVTTSTDGSVAFWAYSHQPSSHPGKQVVKFLSRPLQYNERMRPGQAQMICASFSPGGMFLAAGSADHHVRVYLMEGEEGPHRILETEAHTDRVDSICWAHNELRFISGSKDGTANLWHFDRQQWKNTRLIMAEKLSGEKVTEEEAKLKFKVMMVCWDRSDRWVITAVSDHTLKIWNSDTGALTQVLRGHEDEVFVLESHPCDPLVLLSAGHDGNIFVWNILTGTQINKFKNSIEGQGHGAVFDAKWSPDGTMVAATDSHGHILTFGLGTGSDRLKKLPMELFFHTDYRPLIRDANHFVLDEQTQMAPHLMPPPFLVDIDGNPYPPVLQRLVPGRENCHLDQLVPNIAVSAGGHQEVLGPSEPSEPRSHINEMIEALARQNSADNEAGPSNSVGGTPGRNSVSGGGSTPGGAGASSRNNASSRQGGHLVGMRRAGDVEGVRQSSGNWQRDNDVRWTKRVLIKPVPRAALRERQQKFTILSTQELHLYRKEQRRKPLMITVTAIAGRRKTKRGARFGMQRNERIRGISNLRQSQRALIGQMDDSDFEEPDNVLSLSSDGDYEDVVRNANSRSAARIRMRQTDEESIGSSSPASSSEYSDWIADQGANLEPPKRAKRKPVRASARARRAAASIEESHSDDETDDSDEPVLEPDSEEERKKKPKPKPKPKKKPTPPQAQLVILPSGEIPEPFKPSEWLSQVVPKKSPYYPQMGDEVMFFKEGYQKYLNMVREKKAYDPGPRCEPYEKMNLEEPQLVKVVGIKYEIRPPRLCCLKLCVLQSDGHMTQEFFSIKYHDMNDVIDFFVLKQSYTQALQRNWKEGDEFRSTINDDWWTGVIESKIPKTSPFLSFLVRWDSQDSEAMSPWDLEPLDPDRLPEDRAESVPVLPEEINAMLYQPTEEEWPQGGREVATQRILHGLEQVMALSAAEDFLTPVDLTLYPSYALTIEYPIDLSLIKARFENHFYRRITAAQFDVRYLATNAEKFNEPHSPIVKTARIVTDLCLSVISSPVEMDVSEAYHQVLDSYLSSGSEETKVDVEDDDKPGPSGINSNHVKAGTSQRSGSSQKIPKIDPEDWIRQCIDLLELLWQREDAEPFKEPVDTEEHPDYLLVVKTPMDLSIIRSRLIDGDYENPMGFANDVRLIFSNSKSFNVNKASKIYAMTVRLSNLFENHMKEIVHDWKAARIRSQTSLLKGRQTKVISSDTEDSGVEPLRPASQSSSESGNYTRTRGSKRSAGVPPVMSDEEDEGDEDEGEDVGDEEELVTKPGPSSRVGRSQGMANGQTSSRLLRQSTRSAQPLDSDSESDYEASGSTSLATRSTRNSRKRFCESDSSLDSDSQTTKRRRVVPRHSTAQADESEESQNSSFQTSNQKSSVASDCSGSLSAARTVRGSLSAARTVRGKGKAPLRNRVLRQQNGLHDSSDLDSSEKSSCKKPSSNKLNNAKGESESDSGTSSESSSSEEEEDEAEDTAESEDSEETVDLHAPPLRTTRATRSKSGSSLKHKRKRVSIVNGQDDSDDDEDVEEEEEDDGVEEREDDKGEEDNEVDIEDENVEDGATVDTSSEDEDEDTGVRNTRPARLNGMRKRFQRASRKNYNESDSEDATSSARKKNPSKRPVRAAAKNRQSVKDFLTSDEDEGTVSSNRRRRTTKPNYAEEESEEESKPIITVSSRGRVRKVTEKARALLKH